jgi:carbon monoxide dehydrogenase subunit G
MQRVSRRAVVDASPQAVFDYVADLDNLAGWQSGIVEARRTSEGAIGLGSTARVVRQLMGQRLEAPLTVTRHEPPNVLAVESTVSGVQATAVIELAPLDGGSATDVSFTMEISASGLTAFMEPMIASAASGDLAASLDRLRSVFAEGG